MLLHLPVFRDTKSECSRQGATAVTSDNVFISSDRHQECSWHITSTSGRQLNITLYTYSTNQLRERANEPPVCYEAITVKETKNRNQKTVLVCPSDPTAKTVYISEGTSVKISFSDTAKSDSVTYLVQIQGSLSISDVYQKKFIIFFAIDVY